MSRYDTYRKVMTDQKHWQKTLGIITCKIIREKYKAQFNVLIDVLHEDATKELVIVNDWHLAFTGGTFESLPDSIKHAEEYRGRVFGLAPSAAGVIQIANLAVYGHLFAVAFFNHMDDLYADSPQNLCLRRICNQCRVPLLEDDRLILYCLKRWQSGLLGTPAPREEPYPEQLIREYYGRGKRKDNILYSWDLDHKRLDRTRETIAVVAHDGMKMEMMTFCACHMRELLEYRRVLGTGTTAGMLRRQFLAILSGIGAVLPKEHTDRWGWDGRKETVGRFLNTKIQPFESGPKGGDVQISSKVIDGSCHRVLFFQDPQSAHPHAFDIRLMEKAVQDPDTAALFATSFKTAEAIV